MKFGLDAFVLLPPFNALLSLAMIAGVDALGLIFLKYLKISTQKQNALWLRCQSPLFGAAVLTFVFFPAALAGVFTSSIAMTCAYTLSIWGAFHALQLFRGALSWSREIGGMKSIGLIEIAFIVLAVCYVLIALAPITDADSLDYHVGVALDILNSGAFPFKPEWFHSRIAGSGEILIAIGLSVGAEQFGALLQCVGLLCVVSFFFVIPGKGQKADKWLALVCISSPVFIALASSAKPMLLPAAMTTSALLLVHFQLSKISEKSPAVEVRNAFILVCLLVMASANMKMNYMLSGGIIGCLAVLFLVNSKFRLTAISVGTLMFCATILPFAFWKSYYFGGGLLDALLQPFPGDWPGTNSFEKMLRDYRDTSIYFPISLLIPSGLNKITTVLGIGLIFLLSCSRWYEFQCRELVIAILLVSIGYIVFGQLNSRFFIEPLYWVFIAYHLESAKKSPSRFLETKTVKILISIQVCLVLISLTFGISQLLPGALSPSLRKNVMHRFADGYDVMSWANEVLPPDVTIISKHRSVGLAARPVISNDWEEFIRLEVQSGLVYSSIVARKSPEFMIVLSNAPPDPMHCFSEIYAGPYTAEIRRRNPFNSIDSYNAWILKKDLFCSNKGIIK